MIKMNYMVYFVSDGIREGAEIIEANSREEAVSLYSRFFNVNKEEIKAIPRISVERENAIE